MFTWCFALHDCIVAAHFAVIMVLYVEPFPVVLVDCAYVGSLNLYQASTPCRLACNAVCAAGGATRGVLECVRMAGAAADCHAGAPAVADRCKNGINTYEALWCHQLVVHCSVQQTVTFILNTFHTPPLVHG